MYTVIFSATAKAPEPDPAYMTAAIGLRDLALGEYGCLAFTSYSQGDSEIAISYWPSMAHIQAWAQAAEHNQAKALGKSRWRASYHVTIAETVSQPNPASHIG